MKTTPDVYRLTMAAMALVGLVVLAAAGTWVQAADWPQFRGPDRTGISAESGLLASWPAGGPEILWRTKLGEGFSAISVVDGTLFTLAGQGKKERLVAVDAASGKERWAVDVGEKWVDRWGNGPRSTPTIDGDVVYALGSKGNLVAAKRASGEVIWRRDLQADYEARPPRWGVSTSPLVEGKLLLVNVGGADGSSVVAFDKKSGAEVWRSQDDKPGYSAPIAFTAHGQRQVLFLTAGGLVALSPTDGKKLWSYAWKTSYDVNASTPIFQAPDRVFISTGYDVGAALLKLKAGKSGIEVEEVWRNREMKNKFSSSVLIDGFLYGFDEKTLKCVELATGETRWRKRDLGHGSLIAADGHLIVMGESGQLALVEATPEDYVEKGLVQIFEGKTWTMPTLADGKLYLRDESELISVKVAG